MLKSLFLQQSKSVDFVPDHGVQPLHNLARKAELLRKLLLAFPDAIAAELALGKLVAKAGLVNQFGYLAANMQDCRAANPSRPMECQSYSHIHAAEPAFNHPAYERALGVFFMGRKARQSASCAFAWAEFWMARNVELFNGVGKADCRPDC